MGCSWVIHRHHLLLGVLGRYRKLPRRLVLRISVNDRGLDRVGEEGNCSVSRPQSATSKHQCFPIVCSMSFLRRQESIIQISTMDSCADCVLNVNPQLVCFGDAGGQKVYGF